MRSESAFTPNSPAIASRSPRSCIESKGYVIAGAALWPARSIRYRPPAQSRLRVRSAEPRLHALRPPVGDSRSDRMLSGLLDVHPCSGRADLFRARSRHHRAGGGRAPEAGGRPSLDASLFDFLQLDVLLNELAEGTSGPEGAWHSARRSSAGSSRPPGRSRPRGWRTRRSIVARCQARLAQSRSAPTPGDSASSPGVFHAMNALLPQRDGRAPSGRPRPTTPNAARTPRISHRSSLSPNWLEEWRASTSRVGGRGPTPGGRPTLGPRTSSAP